MKCTLAQFYLNDTIFYKFWTPLVIFESRSLYPVFVMLCIWDFVPPPEWNTFLLRYNFSIYLSAAYSRSLSQFTYKTTDYHNVLANSHSLVLFLFLSHISNYKTILFFKPFFLFCQRTRKKNKFTLLNDYINQHIVFQQRMYFAVQ